MIHGGGLANQLSRSDLRRLLALLISAPLQSRAMTSPLASSSRRIDAHLHLWTDGADWAEGKAPPEPLRT